MALGLGMAAGSMGQVIYSPFAQAMISAYGWYPALIVLSVSTLLIIPLAFVLPNDPGGKGRAAAEQTMGAALREAMGHGSYLMLTAGFFVCGFHVSFIGVHFPAYVKDLGFSPAIGAMSLMLIGLFNIAGSLGAGWIGQRWRKAYGLSAIYFLRCA